MNAQQVSQAVLTLQSLSEHAQRLRKHCDEAAQLVRAFDLSTLYLLDYLAALDRGLDPYDALLAAARGDSPADPGQ